MLGRTSSARHGDKPHIGGSDHGESVVLLGVRICCWFPNFVVELVSSISKKKILWVLHLMKMKGEVLGFYLIKKIKN